MDKIIIKSLKIFSYHGVNPEEKENGQDFFLDVVLYRDLKKPGKTDSIDDTISYSKAIKTIKKAMAESSYDLIERAATKVAKALFEDFSSLLKVDILLKKPMAPINAEFDYVAVEIFRKRDDF
ncbi:MAG: Dihydroneopterin aldolase [Eubacteriales bacterium SKADARSKE-1]|nr:Dihydroneopterin aldolase [Eubacteriales bacterium SKADARSKE-1]